MALIIIGRVNSHDQSIMFGLVALAAISIEGGNSANFALVPHVHPFTNGIVWGLTGAESSSPLSSASWETAQTTPRPSGSPGASRSASALLTVRIPPIPKNQMNQIDGH